MPFPTPRDLPNPELGPMSLATPALAGGFFTTVPPGKPYLLSYFRQLHNFISPKLILGDKELFQFLFTVFWEIEFFTILFLFYIVLGFF